MKVRDVMTTEVVTVRPETPFAEIVSQLLWQGISGVPVVDDDGRLLGVVTEADLVSNEAYGYRRRRALALIGDYLRGFDPGWVRKASARTARELMTAAPDVARPDEQVADVARRMLEERHKRLPVVEDGRVVGIVSRHDLLRQFHRPDEETAGDIERLLADPFRAPETHAAAARVENGIVTLEGTVQRPSDKRVVEAAVAQVPGVVAVDNRLEAREPEPRAF
ncbi:MAG TPA: CBS domain-containing protein [Nocardioidaceae bacterium]